MTNKSTPLTTDIKINKIKEDEVYTRINEILENDSGHIDLNRIFAEKAMLLSKREDVCSFRGLEGLAKYISKNMYVFSELISWLRACCVHEKSDALELGGFDRVKKFMILALLTDFKTLGMIEDFIFDSEKELLTGIVRYTETFRAFICGGFYEVFACKQAEKVLRELADTYGADYEVYRDVYVHIPVGNRNVETREIDLLIRFDNREYIVEVKSGNAHRTRNFYTIGRRLNIAPLCSILLVRKLADYSTEKAEEQYGLYMCDGDGFFETLRKMIRDRFLADQEYEDLEFRREEFGGYDFEFEEYLDNLSESCVESIYDNAFQNGFREGYSEGECDSAEYLIRFKKRVAHILLLSGRFTDDEILFTLLESPELLDAVRKEIAEKGREECIRQLQNYIKPYKKIF